jgi:DNA polymerase elongation subunit (family B)
MNKFEIIDYKNIYPLKIESYFNDIYFTYIDLTNNKKKFQKIPFKPYYYISDSNNPVEKVENCQKIFSENAYQMFEESLSQPKKTYQADLKLHRIFMLEKFNEVENLIYEKELKTGFIDIENYVNGKIDVTSSNPITAISVLNSTTNEINSFVYAIDINKSDKENNIYIYSSEFEMLKAFIVYMKFEEYDLITGWNSQYYDIPYICFRLQNYNIINDLSPFKLVKQKFKRNEFDIYGLSHIDYLELYKKYKKENIGGSYSLDNIAKLELNKGKSQYEGSLNNLWKSDIKKFIEYNRNDVQLIKEIDDKVQFIKLATEIKNISFCNFEDVLHNSIVLDNLFLRKQNRTGNVLNSVKSKKDDYEDSEDNDIKEDNESKYAGAYVKDPRVGIRDFIIDLDCESQYPSVIMYLNISPETKIGKIITEKNEIFYFTDEDNKILNVRINNKNEIVKITQKEFKEFIKKNEYLLAANGAIFKHKKDDFGFIPKITEWIFMERKKNKKLMFKKMDEKDLTYKEYDIKQKAYKELSVSIYGVLGFSSSRFFDIELAEAITLTGQKIIKKAIKLVESKDYDVVTTDTDSLLISFPLTIDNIVGEIVEKTNDKIIFRYKDKFYNLSINIAYQNIDKEILKFYISHKVYFHGKYLYKSNLYDVESCVAVGNELSKFVDENLKQFSTDEFNSDFANFHFKNEFVAKKGIFLSKKHYALYILLNEGKEKDELLFKGLEVVRSDIPKFAVKYLKGIYEAILRTDDIEKVENLIKEYKEEVHKVDINELGIPTSIKDFRNYKNIPIHVRGAKLWEKYYSKETNVFFENVNRCKYFFLDKTYIPERMKGDLKYEDLKNFVITVPENQKLPCDLKIDYKKFEDRLIGKTLENIVNSLKIYKIENEIFRYYQEYKDNESNIYKYIDFLFEKNKNIKFERFTDRTIIENYIEKYPDLTQMNKILTILNYYLNQKYDINNIYEYIRQKILKIINPSTNLNSLF